MKPPQALQPAWSNHWRSKKWDVRLRDSWPEALADQDGSRLTTDHTCQCTNRRWGIFNQCVFYKAREGVQKWNVIAPTMILVPRPIWPGRGRHSADPRDCLYNLSMKAIHLPDKAIGPTLPITPRMSATAEKAGATGQEPEQICWAATSFARRISALLEQVAPTWRVDQ